LGYALQNVMSHMQDLLESSEFAEETLPREEGAVVLIVRCRTVIREFEDKV
jgi:hypothetical protein